VSVPGASHVVLDPGSPTLRGVGMGMIIVGGVADGNVLTLARQPASRRYDQYTPSAICTANALKRRLTAMTLSDAT
jgi:hypothetical protein